MRVLAVADTDVATGQVGHFDAVAVGEAERALEPARAGRSGFWRNCAHVIYLAECRVIMVKSCECVREHAITRGHSIS